ncbi:MAG: zinc ribbon domain-containing protein [Acidobacteria bacterium]|nr:zinc ribbon domain-containing protein [Acidobacteriota bacterium]
MPLYEYRCQECETRFEKLVRASAPGVVCPKCGGGHLEQQYSTFAAKASGPAEACPPAGCGACGGPRACSMN